MPGVRHALRPVLALGLALAGSPHAATWVVDSTVDEADALRGDGACAGPSGRCTLRAAVDEAAAGDEVLVPAGTYRLDSTLRLSRPVAIAGASASVLTNSYLFPDGQPLVRASGRGDFVLRDLVLTSSAMGPGAWIMDGTSSALMLASCTVGPGAAGGVRLQNGSLVVDGCAIQAVRDVGIWVNEGDLTVRDSRISGIDGKGILARNVLVAHAVRIERSWIMGNRGTSLGGGGLSLQGGTAVIDRCTIADNGGGPGFGGILLDEGADVTMTSCRVEGNRSGIYAFGAGGVHVVGSRLRIVGSTISSNGCEATGDFGGGIGASDADVAIVNSTLSGNWVLFSDVRFPPGGGVRALPGATVTILSTTIVGAARGPETGHVHADVGAVIRFGNTVIAGDAGPGVSGSLECLGWSFIEDPGSAVLTGDLATLQTGSDPALSDLGDNGGDLFTHLPLAGSPLVDAGDPSGCLDDLSVPLVTDERGEQRVADGDDDDIERCDIGAVEVEGSGPDPSDAPTESAIHVRTQGLDVVITWTDRPGEVGTSHDIARDTLTAMLAARGANAPCVAQAFAGAAWIDATSADVAGLYWIVRPRNDAGPGAWGTNSLGSPRPTCP